MTLHPHKGASDARIGGGIAEAASLSEVFRESLGFLHRYFKLILVMSIISGAVFLVVTHRMERLYKSSAQLMIDAVPSSPIDVEKTPLSSPTTEYVDAQTLLIAADDTLLKVVERGQLVDVPFFRRAPPSVIWRTLSQIKNAVLGPKPDVGSSEVGTPSREALVAKSILSEVLSVERQGDTNIITISVRANSPALAQRVTTLVAETYVDHRLTKRRQDAKEFSDWIGARAEELRQQVSVAENAVTEYRVQHDLFGDQDGGSLNDQQLTEVNTALLEARADLAQKTAALTRARTVAAGDGDVLSLPEVQLSEIINELRNQMLLLELRERDLSAASDQSNPRLLQIRQQYDEMKRQLDDEVERIIGMLANEVETLESRTALLSEALSKAGGDSKLETQISVDLRQLERVAAAYRQYYQRYLENAGLAAELKSFTTSGTQMVTSATMPLDHFFPSVTMFTIFGVMLGAAAAIIIGALRNALDMTFHSPQEVERVLGIKVLAQLSKLRTSTRIPDILETDPQSPFSETISVLRYLMCSVSSDDNNAPVLLVLSNGEGEGKTSIAASLAKSASLASQNVLLIDGNLRHASLSETFGFKNEIGLADVLQGASWQPLDIVSEGVLDIMPAGILTDMPVSALESHLLPKFLDLARDSYDLVVIDGPPMTHLADCSILAKFCDQILFVMRAGVTRRDQSVRAFQNLPKSKITGVAMTDCPQSSPIGLSSTYKVHEKANKHWGKAVSYYHRETEVKNLAQRRRRAG
ncbi:GumC family protein [Sulfitobacter sp. 916]|uniref:GumC family protein n=1 Tax=Sulfitobacter sp. 916 TaxID=3368559 RepID=UPI0037461E45